MTALFDIRTILKIVTFPFRIFSRGDSSDFETFHSRRTPIIESRWRRAGDGKLEGRWVSGN